MSRITTITFTRSQFITICLTGLAAGTEHEERQCETWNVWTRDPEREREREDIIRTSIGYGWVIPQWGDENRVENRVKEGQRKEKWHWLLKWAMQLWQSDSVSLHQISTKLFWMIDAPSNNRVTKDLVGLVLGHCIPAPSLNFSL